MGQISTNSGHAPFFAKLLTLYPSLLYVPGFLLSLAIITFFLYLGISRFRKMEKTFADLIVKY